jgi:stage III sporulation protein AF
MQFLTEWITNIILFVLLATIIEMLIPNSSMQKYVKMVTGLLLIVIILTPLLNLFKKDFEQLFSSLALTPILQEKNIENVIEMKKKEIQASQRAYILEQMAVQLKNEVEEELMQQYGFQVESVHVSINDEYKNEFSAEDIDSIEVILSKKENSSNSIPAVKPISIDTSKPINHHQGRETNTSKEINRFLANKWGIDGGKIAVIVERRDQEFNGS